MAGIGAALAAAPLLGILWLSGPTVDLYVLDGYFAVPAWRLAAAACLAPAAAAALLVPARRGA
jgi:hypothetical protein